MKKQKLIKIFDNQAAQYAKRIGDPKEKKFRQQLIGHARGKVLELAVGAGANFPFYPSEVEVTAVDFSHAMLEKARQSANQYRIHAEFICDDMEKLDFDEGSFDTVISTLSLCSYDNPHLLLRKMNRWCKPDGRILLMEHGISSNPVISVLQRTFNPLLYRVYGCHQTRDVQGLLRESGMNIDSMESHWLNMVHLVRARPQL
ncbi:class I SAM-dependent methyltransferase [Paenibacillus sp. M1]|uniref:Class I SAM-dependent methyltransferase n=1 Tax=Paenibacillus haidiansis TaxID=1574488 RepID=A0ABU7VQ11_9BACL